MKKRILAMLLMVCMVLTLMPAVFAANEAVFTDVAEDAWYATEVQWAYENKLMEGTGGKLFQPDICTTRGMIATVLWRMEGKPEAAIENSFSDVVEGQWYTDGILWANEQEIILGYGDGKCGPTDKCTREQLAVALYRYAEYKGYDVEGEADLSDYPDAAKISDWAAAEMEWAVAKGLIQGTDAGVLIPDECATRAQTAVILYRMSEKLVEEEPEEPEHTHVWDEGTVTTEPTCTEKGVKTYKCACGETKTEDIAAAGHTWDEGTVTTEPTCTEKGVKTYKCACGETKTEDIAATGEHEYGEYAPNGDGTHTRVCAFCSGSETADCTYVESVGDTSTTYTCSVCEDAYTVNSVEEEPVARIGAVGYTTLQAAVDAVTDSTAVEIIVFSTDDPLTTNFKVSGGRNITFVGETGNAEDVVLEGQIATTSSIAGSLTFKNVTINVDDKIVDSTGISQTASSAIALWGNQTVTCENVVFNMSKADSTAITGWWDTGVGTSIVVKNCTFNCNGQRPIRTCGNLTVENTVFNDPYRYAVQLTAKASTATLLENAVVNFKNNTINNGENGKTLVYGIQLEGDTYGCQDLIINGSGNTVNAGSYDTQNESAMYYCECGKVDHSTVVWNTEVAPVHANAIAEGVIKTSNKTYEIISKAGLMNLDAVLEASDLGEGKGAVVNLAVDIDMTGETWTPITRMWYTFNGNGHTISNLNCGQDQIGRSGFLGYAGAVTINDLTLENVTANGSQAGTFAGSGEGLKVNNCMLKGNNTVSYAATAEKWNGIGAITGILTDSAVNVTIAEGATVTLNRGDMTTDFACTYVDDLTGHIQANGGSVTNNGTITANGSITYVASTDAALKSMIDNATGTATILLADGNYRMPTSSTNATITICGSEDAVIDLTWGAYLENAALTFQGVTIKGSTGYVTSNGTSYGSDYAALYSKDVNYKECVFSGPFRIGRDGASFTDCTFNDLGNDYIWTYGNDATFTGCIFNSAGKALLIYSDGGSEVSEVTVKNCTFNATAGAKAGAIANQNCAAIEIHNYGNGVNLATSNNTVDSDFSGEWRIKTYESGKPGITVNGMEYTTIALDGRTMTIDANKNVTVQ